MPARAATPFDAPRIGALLERSLRTPETILASALPVAFAGGTITGTRRMALGLVGLGGGRLRVFLSSPAIRHGPDQAVELSLVNGFAINGGNYGVAV